MSPGVSDAELRKAYRRLVKLHHPDHNAGSEESEQRFEAIQAAYAQIRELRGSAPRGPAPPRPDGDTDARLEDLERQIRDARAARERARKAAREAATASRDRERERPSDEDLGYVTTDDSFSKILSDARDGLIDWFEQARRRL